MKCPNCGIDLDSNVRFCTKCGFKMENSQQSLDEVLTNNSCQTSDIDDEAEYDAEIVDKKKFVWKNSYSYLIVGLAIVMATGGVC